MKSIFFRMIPTTAIIVLFIGCSEPQTIPIEFNRDHCDHCQMTIADKKFGAELVTKKGKIYKFDAIECLSAFYLDETTVSHADIHSMWVIDLVHPRDFIDAEKAHYFHCDGIKTPMGMNVSAINTAKELETVKINFVGEELAWQGVLDLTKKTKVQ